MLRPITDWRQAEAADLLDAVVDLAGRAQHGIHPRRVWNTMGAGRAVVVFQQEAIPSVRAFEYPARRLPDRGQRHRGLMPRAPGRRASARRRRAAIEDAPAQ